MLFVISSYGHRQLDNAGLRRKLVHVSRRSRVLVGLDSGAWLMASAGLLDGHRATIHRDLIENLSEEFLKLDIVQSAYVIDGNRITCGGAMAAFDLVLELIGKAHGAILRMDIAALFLHGDAGLQPAVTDGNAGGDIITRALAIMQSSIETPLSMRKLCLRLDCNIKTLERRFQKQLKQNPTAVFRHLRLMEARRLVENTDLPVTEIAVRSGYENASAMTRAFKAKFGTTPRALRMRVEPDFWLVFCNHASSVDEFQQHWFCSRGGLIVFLS